jgi:hypothetical protein
MVANTAGVATVIMCLNALNGYFVFTVSSDLRWRGFGRMLFPPGKVVRIPQQTDLDAA